MRAFTSSLLCEVVDTPIRVTEIQPGAHITLVYIRPNILFLSLHCLTGLVETEFSIVRYRGDKSAADKVYEGLEPCMQLLASVDCPLMVPPSLSDSGRHCGGNRVGSRTPAARQHR